MIYIGTSGYSYADWKGVFYPPTLAQGSFLDFYAQRFMCVEVNYTYYRMPDAGTLGRMEQKTPAPFRFAVKAYRGMTHEIEAAALDATVEGFRKALDPLLAKGKLGCVLLQFPTSFHYNAGNRKHLARLIEALSPIPVAVEFRGRDWLMESVYKGLKAKGAAFVCVDEPQLEGLIPPLDVTTTGTGYVRFHGRNASAWWSGNAASRYDYRYTEQELREWIPRLRKIAAETEKTFIFTNNHWQGKAVENALMLKGILRDEGLEPV
jgi:uncharacterized protein YecE (DUF72 family)